jgi:hypothetical protein
MSYGDYISGPTMARATGMDIGGGMDPVTGQLIGSGIGALGAAFGGQDSQQLGNLHLVNPAQQALYNAMTKQMLSGSGDYGFGQAFKQGKSQLQDYMASRGVSPQSGVGLQAMGGLAANAAAQDAAGRRQSLFQLMGTPLQTAQVAGANFVPGSPSVGPTTGSQQHNFANKGPQYGQYNWV